MSLTYYCMLEYDIIDMEINKCACNMILEKDVVMDSFLLAMIL